MKKTALIKGLTLFSSISMVAIFLLYRIGYFENKRPIAIIETTQINSLENVNDTIGKDSLEMPILSSSKSLILQNKDLLRLKPAKKKDSFNLPKKKEQYMFSSSKSGRVIILDSVPVISLDSLLKKSKSKTTRQ